MLMRGETKVTAWSICLPPATYRRTYPHFCALRRLSPRSSTSGPEPDRWRNPAEAELNAAQAPEHFIDLEPADALGPLPRNRLDFEAAGLRIRPATRKDRPPALGHQRSLAAAQGCHARVPPSLRCRARTHAPSSRQSSSMPVGSAITSAMVLSLCTQRSNTTAGWAPTQRLHHGPQDSLGIRGTVCGSQYPRAPMSSRK